MVGTFDYGVGSFQVPVVCGWWIGAVRHSYFLREVFGPNWHVRSIAIVAERFVHALVLAAMLRNFCSVHKDLNFKSAVGTSCVTLAASFRHLHLFPHPALCARSSYYRGINSCSWDCAWPRTKGTFSLAVWHSRSKVIPERLNAKTNASLFTQFLCFGAQAKFTQPCLTTACFV